MTKRDYNKLTAHDLEEYLEVNEQAWHDSGILLKVLEEDGFRLLHMARMWGWGDTEVRESLWLKLEEAGVNMDAYK